MSHTAEQQKMIREIAATKGKKAALEYINSINSAAKNEEENIEKGKALAALLEAKTVYQAAVEKMEADIAKIVGDFDESATDENGFAVRHPHADVIRKMRYELAQLKSRAESNRKQIADMGA